MCKTQPLNKRNLKVISLVLIASAATGIGAVATYSGIYNVQSGTVLLAITKGGHLLSLENNIAINESLNPAKSTVNAIGKIMGSANDGSVVVGQIASDFSVSGTIKYSGQTHRFPIPFAS